MYTEEATSHQGIFYLVELIECYKAELLLHYIARAIYIYS